MIISESLVQDVDYSSGGFTAISNPCAEIPIQSMYRIVQFDSLAELLPRCSSELRAILVNSLSTTHPELLV